MESTMFNKKIEKCTLHNVWWHMKFLKLHVSWAWSLISISTLRHDINAGKLLLWQHEVREATALGWRHVSLMKNSWIWRPHVLPQNRRFCVWRNFGSARWRQRGHMFRFYDVLYWWPTATNSLMSMCSFSVTNETLRVSSFLRQNKEIRSSSGGRRHRCGRRSRDCPA